MNQIDEDALSAETRERPEIPVPGDDEEELTRRCVEDREELSPRETADCAGLATSALYETEEDGGS